MHRLARPWLGVTAIVAGSSTLLALGTTRVHEWVVMTDELLYVKLADHTAATGSPLPVLHGEHVGFLGVVYPLLLSPFAAGLGAVDTFTAAHAVNAVLFASAAVPAYLLARRLVPAAHALVVSLLVVAVPWSVGSAFVMSEAASYPVFLWALLACHAALAEPSPRRDALAVGALALAYLTRPQFVVLAAVLPAAALVAAGPRRALRDHGLLAACYAAGILVVVPLAALGESHRLLGDYGVTATHGSLLPAIAWKSAALHLDVLAVGLGVVPLLLGAGWAYSRLRDASPRVRAFAALAALALPLLALETASYDVRFGGPDVIRDRYLFYLAPVLLIGTVLCLLERRLPLAGIAGATVFFAATAGFGDFRPVAGVWADSPQSVLNGLLYDASGPLPAGVFVALCGVVLGGICLALELAPRRATLLGVTVAVFAFGGSAAGYAFERLLTSRTPMGVAVTGQPRVRDWIDRSVGRDVALLAYPVSRSWDQSAVLWWDTELWNERIDRALVSPGGTFTYTPFPATPLRFDFETGVVAGTKDAPRYLLGAANDPRLGLIGTQVVSNVGLTLREVQRPYRASWATRGLEPDGWTRPGSPATLRLYGNPDRAERMQAEVLLDAPPEATQSTRYRLAGRTGSLAPGTRATVDVTVCVPRAGHADLTLSSERSATIAGPPLGPDPGPQRAVGVVVSGVSTHATGEACRP